jgi:hypothetical protein
MADGLEQVGAGKRLLSCGHDKYIKMWRLPLASGFRGRVGKHERGNDGLSW